MGPAQRGEQLERQADTEVKGSGRLDGNRRAIVGRRGRAFLDIVGQAEQIVGVEDRFEPALADGESLLQPGVERADESESGIAGGE